MSIVRVARRIANQVLLADVLPFAQFAPLSVMIDAGFFDTHSLSRWFLYVIQPYLNVIKVEHLAGDAEREKQQQRDRIVSAIHDAKRPLFYFPEGWDTNGKGLLIYQKFLFGLKLPVVPIALSVRVPFAPIRPGMLGSSIFREILWMFFSPYYEYHVRVLPALEHEGEGEIDFALRTQRVTAAALGVPATSYSKSDALTYRRSLLQKKGEKRD